MDSNTPGTTAKTRLVTEIVAAYVQNNSVAATEVPTLIAAVGQAMDQLDRPQAPPAEKPVPPVPIKKTVTPDYIISLEDGRQYKSLKRHLGGRGLTPAQYREKWGLPSDYPMVAPSYSSARSTLAKMLGLGRKSSGAGAEAAPEAEHQHTADAERTADAAAEAPAPADAPAPAKRGRKPKKA